MEKIAVVYWSGTGNTEAMANLVAEGVKEAGAQAQLYTSGEFSPQLADGYGKIAFGCPSMGAEELEESEFEPMFSAVKGKLKDKKIALFGSYGWGDGEWMRNWEENCASDGISLVAESVTANGAPDAEAGEACKELGRRLAGA